MAPPHPAVFDEHDEMVLAKIDMLNTKKCVQFVIRKWNSWRTEKNAAAGDTIVLSLHELMKMSDNDIDHVLAMFIKDLKRANGENYPGSSVRNILFGVMRYSQAYVTDYDQDAIDLSGHHRALPKFNAALRDKLKALKVSIKGTPHKHKGLGFSHAKEAALWDKNILGCHTAHAISDTVCVYVMKIFGIGTGNALRMMHFENFIFSEDEHGKYVELDLSLVDTEGDGKIYNRCFGIRDQETGRLRQYCDPFNERSFYTILKHYFARTASVRETYERTNRPTPLFLIPKIVPATLNNLRTTEFIANPIGKNNLQSKFSKVMRAAKFSCGTYNNQGLVVSIYPQLLVKGYDIRKHDFFQPRDHLQICKVLDPPPGPLILETTPTIVCVTGLYEPNLDPVSTSVQLVKIAPKPEQFVQPKQQPDEVVLPSRQVLYRAAKSQTPAASTIQGYSDECSTDSESSNGPMEGTHVDTHKKQDLPSSSTIANLRQKLASRKQAARALDATTQAASAAVTMAVQHNIKTDTDQDPSEEGLLPLFLQSVEETGVSTTSQLSEPTNDFPPNMIIKCEPVDELEDLELQNIVAQTDNGFNSNTAQAVGETTADIGNSDSTFLHQTIPCHNDNETIPHHNETIPYHNDETIPHKNPDRVLTPTNQRKRTNPDVSPDRDDPESSLHNNKRAKVSMVNRHGDDTETPTTFMTNGNSEHKASTINNHPTTVNHMPTDANIASRAGAPLAMFSSVDMTNGEETTTHTAKIEYSFSNDLKRSSVRQEVIVNDDDQDLFSFSATNKMGKTLSDLDLNLGDYLPDDCLLKPGNINLKRVVTPEGGKLVIQVEYESKC